MIAAAFFASAANAQSRCPVEAKLLLTPPSAPTVVASLGFENMRVGRVYFLDTEALDLATQGVNVRLRRGASNDLTVKVRPPKGNRQIDRASLRDRFPCEIDRTPAGAVTSYAIRRSFSGAVPESGVAIESLLDAAQKALLQEAGVSINWSSVKRIASIRSTTWVTPSKSALGPLALEMWEWPTGKILEISSKSRPGTEDAAFARLQQVVNMNGLSLSDVQDNKTGVVLGTLADPGTKVQ